MIFTVTEAPDFGPRVVATDPDDQAMERVVLGLPWRDLTVAVLSVDDGHLLEGGNIGTPEDGFGVRCVVRGAEYISKTAMHSLDLIVALLQAYRADDSRWTRLVEWDDGLWESVTQGRGRASGASILVPLEPGELDNPDLDIRYALPDLIQRHSRGLAKPDGYDYAREGREPGASAG
jgi:hypothetical protein